MPAQIDSYSDSYIYIYLSIWAGISTLYMTKGHSTPPSFSFLEPEFRTILQDQERIAPILESFMSCCYISAAHFEKLSWSLKLRKRKIDSTPPHKCWGFAYHGAFDAYQARL